MITIKTLPKFENNCTNFISPMLTCWRCPNESLPKPKQRLVVSNHLIGVTAGQLLMHFVGI
ncbi:hypothetical protein KHA80_06600 [Anaerobacillus sp. HL2]|nr:hypothetical protein KHA80_06600 [Anaerobacillus sp. HL2]